MIKLILISLLFSTSAMAADLNLNVGESATIEANVRTHVTCSADSSRLCEKAIGGLETLLNACKEQFTGSYCIDKYWPNFKANNPTCVADAMQICIDNCKTQFTGSYCADYCSK